MQANKSLYSTFSQDYFFNSYKRDGKLGYEADYVTVPVVSEEAAAYTSEKELPVVIRKLKEEMKQAAKALEFERAAELRDRIRDLTKLMLEMGGEG